MTAAEIQWPENGLIPVVIADARTNAVLTVAYANREALERTLQTRETYLWSRSRNALWRKGETSGHTQRVVDVVADCDGDALLYRVIPAGPACHTGEASCFHQPLMTDKERQEEHEAQSAGDVLASLERIIETRRCADPEKSYVARLFSGGVDRIGKKVGEEATELVIAAKNEGIEPLVAEAADLVFHVLVLLAARGVRLDDVGLELRRRMK
ncbi:MAG: bifunctional phosphoribosyl-AMP cyclohydrolase/phosphoribosyl-ATP diphosphatase HisIE [Candidatus Eremiobacteraeota bacterium]|nr:bifunctional phosphoribosyl-AMP cyclohydrolase/phosphoribosyl-ATP diphosphatase HisIE [Candidatus Eremiobacteraeota bacterium]MBV8355707.1 bifunctional phosphoribosyl-AMP cyclohydrolase/phosphoribosyl-ATP diphosphatase HisIE [Candidatus Eremiobacteraeota bacterium]